MFCPNFYEMYLDTSTRIVVRKQRPFLKFLLFPSDSIRTVEGLLLKSKQHLRGATLVEMALLASLISVATVSSLSELSHSIKCQFATLGQRVGTDEVSAAPENQPLLNECNLATPTEPPSK